MSRLLGPVQDGAQTSAMPVVPCDQATMGHPPAGGLPLGMNTTPDTATGPPDPTPESEL